MVRGRCSRLRCRPRVAAYIDAHLAATARLYLARVLLASEDALGAVSQPHLRRQSGDCCERRRDLVAEPLVVGLREPIQREVDDHDLHNDLLGP